MFSGEWNVYFFVLSLNNFFSPADIICWEGGGLRLAPLCCLGRGLQEVVLGTRPRSKVRTNTPSKHSLTSTNLLTHICYIYTWVVCVCSRDKCGGMHVGRCWECVCAHVWAGPPFICAEIWKGFTLHRLLNSPLIHLCSRFTWLLG